MLLPPVQPPSRRIGSTYKLLSGLQGKARLLTQVWEQKWVLSSFPVHAPFF